jgi:hypothetical protein
MKTFLSPMVGAAGAARARAESRRLDAREARRARRSRIGQVLAADRADVRISARMSAETARTRRAEFGTAMRPDGARAVLRQGSRRAARPQAALAQQKTRAAGAGGRKSTDCISPFTGAIDLCQAQMYGLTKP